jgi:Divergent InlB B-repeat domain
MTGSTVVHPRLRRDAVGGRLLMLWCEQCQGYTLHREARCVACEEAPSPKTRDTFEAWARSKRAQPRLRRYAVASLRAVIPLALTGIALSGCGGDSSSMTGPTPQAAATQEAAPVPTPTAPAPAPTASASPSSPRPAPVERVRASAQAQGPGCVSIQGSSCASSASAYGEIGTRGSVTALPAQGRRFLGWSSVSSDCPGETTNPCSFAFDHGKLLVATFGY